MPDHFLEKTGLIMQKRSSMKQRLCSRQFCSANNEGTKHVGIMINSDHIGHIATIKTESNTRAKPQNKKHQPTHFQRFKHSD